MTTVDATLVARLKQLLSPECVLRRDEALARRTTFRVGGRADLYVEPSAVEVLSKLIRFLHHQEIPWFVMGRGSNLLIRDGGIRGVVLGLNHPCFAQVQVEGDHLRCGAGAKLKVVAVTARRAGLSGLEFLEGIPGSVGGALRMNAGAMGKSIHEQVRRVRVVDPEGQVLDYAPEEVEVGYRDCPTLAGCIAVEALLRAVPAARSEIEDRMRRYSAQRWQSQPAAASAGCVFKNPPGIAAGRLVDELGLKGTRVGGAVVSEVHGNFIVNEGAATAQDILRLIELVRERCRRSRGIELETELKIVGEDE